jgi:hypothetical protein
MNIHALRVKAAKPEFSSVKYATAANIEAKRREFRNREAVYIRHLLSPNYIAYVGQRTQEELRARLAELGSGANGNSRAPSKNVKFYSRILKHLPTKPAVPYFKREKLAENTKSGVAKPARWSNQPNVSGAMAAPKLTGNIGFGSWKIRQGAVRPEYKFSKGVGVNFGTISQNVVRNMNNDRVIRTMSTMFNQFKNSKIRGYNTANGYQRQLSNFLNYVNATRGPNSPLIPRVANLRNSIRNLASARLAAPVRAMGKAKRGEVSNTTTARPPIKKAKKPRAAGPNNSNNNAAPIRTSAANRAARTASRTA